MIKILKDNNRLVIVVEDSSIDIDKFAKEVGLIDRFKGTRNQAALDLLEVERQMRQAENRAALKNRK